ncbi:hypothetical protein [Actinocatenispora rupis]|uniref:Uncharacterized protein n=1 Tax=Actinocatenispora rupis TaxID=519421 RepID=A0A8J3NB47_9ACTN|nr:hypothetical protein [Actinocatenispora rupis]GID10400.1 hypothetical protein Aru02nite_12890 [Actinocatenispora rupis]
MTALDLATAVRRLADGVAHWTPSAWAAGTPRRADVLHELVQRLADLGADSESRAHVPVPRLDNDLALPDQLRVVAADLLAADPPADTRTAAHSAVRQASGALLP